MLYAKSIKKSLFKINSKKSLKAMPEMIAEMVHPSSSGKTGLVFSKRYIDYLASQVPSSDEYLYYDVEYPVEDPDVSGEVSIT